MSDPNVLGERGIAMSDSSDNVNSKLIKTIFIRLCLFIFFCYYYIKRVMIYE